MPIKNLYGTGTRGPPPLGGPLDFVYPAYLLLRRCA